ncbi:hypothetical protein KA005_37990, partial [bacterium]|nr:hypothetical protein [bacterium]
MNTVPKLENLGTDFFGPSTSIFIGHNGYPSIYAGPVAAIETDNLEIIDSPGKWFGKPYGQLINMRSTMLRSKHKESIFSRSKNIEMNQELALASKPTDVEMSFKKKPTFSFEFSDMTQPMGPTAVIQKMKITENTKIENKVERIARDDLKANEASFKLYNINQDVYKITTILSSGILGLGRNKKLVPTRWSITATDSIIFNNIIPQVKDFPSVNEYLVYSNSYLDNHYQILLMPGNWEFENFEAWSPGSYWAQDLKAVEVVEEYEPFKGRTNYANLQGGGYYASRIAIAEGLMHLKRQARVVVFREIHEGYKIPLGVWQVRENVRNAFKKQPEKFTN